ncbi:MAG: pantetheine-phosphate adenylyltransferase [Comamonas sp. SCN 65-56]|uniref:pantetheine-phosphate adenylyltransferase n=1 Tax=Comamonas sp. SCN 65-56 TaxID=1660095 RepID=UPI00086DC207|nr:pantetheine-phosphate adenylyltransferase [Comamonas sp. SCN 65-56]ODS93937.1 MAG: pantetheine-phosphate adenylyltransferase [Comamonas sp. SCN 65-56]
MSATIAVFPGTFDPITLGHEDMLRRAAALFGTVIVAVAMAHHKKTLFTLDERLQLARDALADRPNVQVQAFDGLVTEFAVAHGARVMVRGLRSGTDLDYEYQLAGMNRHLRPEVDTVFLTPDARWQSISSTLVREIAQLGGKVDGLVSSTVLPRLLAKVGRA